MTTIQPTGKKSLRSGLQRLVERSGKVVSRRPRTTVAGRKTRLLEGLENWQDDPTHLATLNKRMANFTDLIIMDLGKDLILSEDSAFTLMSQALATRDIDEFMQVCRSRVKEFFFAHLNEMLAREGVEDPENTNGALEVPALGMKFCREGSGQGDPTINEPVLRSFLGDRWEEFFDLVVIPEQKTYTLNVERLVTESLKDPALWEQVKGAVEPGGPKTPRMVLRNL